MDLQRTIDEKLGYPVGWLANSTAISPARVFVIRYSTAREVCVTNHPPFDCAIHFDGLYCPIPEVTLLIERPVAEDWGLMGQEST